MDVCRHPAAVACDDGEGAQVVTPEQSARVFPEPRRPQRLVGMGKPWVLLLVDRTDRPTVVAAVDIRQRRALKALRNAGFLATVSMRAFMVEPCRLFVLAQKGKRSQARRCTCRPSPRSSTAEARWVSARA